MKGPTAYMLFSEEQRPEVTAKLRAEAPEGKVAVTAVAKAIGELWKGLSEEEKATYKEKAQQRATGAHEHFDKQPFVIVYAGKVDSGCVWCFHPTAETTTQHY